jgi:hypothetical protein
MFKCGFLWSRFGHKSEKILRAGKPKSSSEGRNRGRNKKQGQKQGQAKKKAKKMWEKHLTEE